MQDQSVGSQSIVKISNRINDSSIGADNTQIFLSNTDSHLSIVVFVFQSPGLDPTFD